MTTPPTDPASPAPLTSTGIDPNDHIRPIVAEKTINFTYKGDKLDKADSNWKVWSLNMMSDLDMAALGAHLGTDENPPNAPDRLVHPRAHRNWESNDRVVRGYLRRNISYADLEHIELAKTAASCWALLKKRHTEEGPIKQVNLIHKALSVRIHRDEHQTKKAREVREHIRQAMRMPGGITEDTLISIALLNDLVPGQHDHLRAIIQRDLQNATEAKPYSSDRIIELIEQDEQVLLGDKERESTDQATALLALQKTQVTKKREREVCTNCRGLGHTLPFCVKPGGGMDGKSIEEASTAKKAARAKTTTSKNTGGDKKVPYQFKNSAGKVLYTIQVDPSAVPALDVSQTEFVGLASTTGVEEVKGEGMGMNEIHQEKPHLLIHKNKRQ